MVAEAAAAALHRATGEDTYARWYETWRDHIAEVFLDPEDGSWRHELNPTNRASSLVWEGKPDTYHALQATLVPRLPLPPALAPAVGEGLLG